MMKECNGFCGEQECKENQDNCKRIKQPMKEEALKEVLRLAFSTLDEVRSETFRLRKSGQLLYAEKKVWDTIYAIKQVLKEK